MAHALFFRNPRSHATAEAVHGSKLSKRHDHGHYGVTVKSLRAHFSNGCIGREHTKAKGGG